MLESVETKLKALLPTCIVEESHPYSRMYDILDETGIWGIRVFIPKSLTKTKLKTLAKIVMAAFEKAKNDIRPN
jgi:hypothetical protein